MLHVIEHALFHTCKSVECVRPELGIELFTHNGESLSKSEICIEETRSAQGVTATDRESYWASIRTGGQKII
jgi:hypothetical protein